MTETALNMIYSGASLAEVAKRLELDPAVILAKWNAWRKAKRWHLGMDVSPQPH